MQVKNRENSIPRRPAETRDKNEKKLIDRRMTVNIEGA